MKIRKVFFGVSVQDSKNRCHNYFDSKTHKVTIEYKDGIFWVNDGLEEFGVHPTNVRQFFREQDDIGSGAGNSKAVRIKKGSESPKLPI